MAFVLSYELCYCAEKSKFCSCAGWHGGHHPLAWKNLWSRQDIGLQLITIIILVSVAWSEPTHWLLCSHRLGAECFSTGVPDGVKDQRFEQTLSEDGEGRKDGIHQKMPWGFKGTLPIWRMDFNNLVMLTKEKESFVSNVLKKITAITLTSVLMGTGGSFCQKQQHWTHSCVY